MAQKKTDAKKRQAAVIAQATTPPKERVDAGLVEKDFEAHTGQNEISSDTLDQNENQLSAQRKSGAPAGGVYDDFRPSTQQNPYVSEEEQGMEMRPSVVGPPAYGSPRPETSSGRLVPLEQHPLRVDALPDGHPAAISGDYGEGQTGTLKGVDTVTSRPSAPLSDLERDTIGERDEREADEEASENSTEAAVALADENGVSLSEVQGSGEGGRITKTDVQDFIDNRDNA